MDIKINHNKTKDLHNQNYYWHMDIMKEASMKYNIPIVAYNVSGEYAMVKAAAANGWIDEKKIVMENMVGLKRAGAKMIITYHALDVAKWLKEEER